VRYACTVAELRAGGGMRPITLGAREVLVVGTDDGIRAVDRSCPHEGFRLDAGEVRGQELTCPAHGWRFDLRSGACVTAGEDIRTYTVDVRDGAIFVDVDVAPTDQELTLASEAVLGALETGRGSLAARRTARLLALGEDPRRVALLLARYGGSHADAGLDPETAAVADALALVPHLDERAVALVFADVASALAARLARASPRFGPDPATPFAWSDAGPRATLAALVDGGDADECEAVVAGMLATGIPVREIAAGLAEGTARTFRGPWPLVVLERAVRLADELGPDAARVVLPVRRTAAPPVPRCPRRSWPRPTRWPARRAPRPRWCTSAAARSCSSGCRSTTTSTAPRRCSAAASRWPTRPPPSGRSS